MVARARRSPSARLYSSVPRSSQWPSTRTNCLGLADSHFALASRILASPGRMSDLSKSKWIIFSSGVASNSRGAGRGGVAAGGAGCGAGGGVWAWDTAVSERVTVVAVAAPVGAGADACVRAGRLAQPASATTRIETDTIETRATCQTMMSSFSALNDLLLGHG